MKKVIKSMLLLFMGLMISGCGKTTIDESRTIVLNVDSEVTPKFTSNYGEGSYDENTRKYTHTISSIKDTYITLSYENLKSITVLISTDEMGKKTIEKDITFGKSLDAEVEVVVNGVKSLEGLTITSPSEYSNLEIGNRNSFKFSLPTRNEDYNLKFSLPNFREFEFMISKEKLINGFAEVNLMALKPEQIYIGFEGKEFSFDIYSQSTNQIVARDYIYSDSNKIHYVLLDNNDSYYVMYYSASNQYVKEVNQGENVIFKTESPRYINGYLHVNLDGKSYSDFLLYNKSKKRINNDNYLSQNESIDNIGLIFNYNEKWLYIDDIFTTAINTEDSNYLYDIDLTKAIEVSIEVSKIHNFTNELIETTLVDDIYSIYKPVNVRLEGNVFKCESYINEAATAYIDLYDKNNVKIGTVDHYINMNFHGSIVSNTINYQGRTVPYTFPIYMDKLVYNESKGIYTYPNQVIDTSNTYLSIYRLQNNYNFYDLSSESYIIDSEGNTIVSVQIGNNYYFELEENKDYTVYIANEKYDFTLTEDDVKRGSVLIYGDEYNMAKFKANKSSYSISYLSNPEVRFHPNEDNIIEVPILKTDSTKILYLYNNEVHVDLEFNIDFNTPVELGDFYVLDNATITDDENYITRTIWSGDGKHVYSYINNDDITQFKTNLTDENYNNYYIDITNFVYKAELDAYYYNIEDSFDYVLTGNTYYLSFSSYVSYGESYYLMNTDVVQHGLTVYDLSIYNSKKLYVDYVFGDGEGEILFTPVQ